MSLHPLSQRKNHQKKIIKMSDEKQPLTEHLGELRARLIRIVFILFFGFVACYGFSEKIFEVIRAPILPFLPTGGQGLHYIGVFEKFMAHLKVSFLAGVFLTMPFWLYQVWKFIAPGLYSKEKKYAISFIFSGVLLFLSGALFAYFLVMPAAFKFLISFGGSADIPIITINEYLDFIIKFFLGFGAAFEIPLVIVFLGMMGVVDVTFLKKNRRWAILIMAVISAIVTPPDAISMVALLGPLILLYEISIVLVRIFEPSKKFNNN
ncbi:MAG: twin-arginine translocase subunit TatC [Oligoflexia bacterium]|nr:twin-arginine translocase subunit TatC [Oligoflexia bacterium]